MGIDSEAHAARILANTPSAAAALASALAVDTAAGDPSLLTQRRLAEGCWAPLGFPTTHAPASPADIARLREASSAVGCCCCCCIFWLSLSRSLTFYFVTTKCRPRATFRSGVWVAGGVASCYSVSAILRVYRLGGVMAAAARHASRKIQKFEILKFKKKYFGN